MRRAQASMEYMITVGIILLIVVPTAYLFYRQANASSEEIDLAQADRFGRAVVANAESVYYLGPPSRIIIEERLPQNVQDIGIIRDPVSQTYLFSITIKTSGGILTLTFPTNVNIVGAFANQDLNEGIKKIRLEAKTGLGSQLFTGISFDGPLSRVFVTSTTSKGDMNGIPGANEICQQLADDASLSGTWKAWLSNTTDNAIDLISDGTYVNVENALIASRLGDLTDGTINRSIQLDESGDDVGTVDVWKSLQ